MSRARQQDGFAIIVVMLIMVVMLGLGGGLLLFADSQQRASARTGANEAAFNLAEAALNAQMFQLSRSWPTSASSNPSTCTAATSASTNFCPDPGGLSNGYTVPASSSCAAGTGTDAWGAAAGTQWATYVRDDGAGTSQLFSSATDKTQPTYDANGDGTLWIRAVGVAGCSVETVVALVSQQLVPLSFPTDALSANWFATGNNGNKVLIDTQGSAFQAGVVSTRCGAGAPVPCQNFRAGQVSPYINASPPTPSPILSAAQLALVKAEAQANSTYFTSGSCPTSITALTGSPTYIEGCGALSFTGNGSANSAAAPGWMVLADGTMDVGGTTSYYGTIYAVDGQGSSGTIISTSGTGLIQGAVDVDGLGGVGINASKLNLVYDPTSFGSIKTYAGVTQVPNSFRLLPGGQ
jgi:Tfp pilus assembly protein PilX